MRVSVIIPTLNEADNLEKTLATIPNGTEVIVSDGGSTDQTREIAKAAQIIMIETERLQRAHQMNAGANQASGDILLFLHADTRLPENGLRTVTERMQDPAVVGGCFARRFDHNSTFLKMTTRLAGVRSHIWGWMLGDQTIFVRKDVFNKLGGFQEWDSFEDLDFSQRMRQQGKTIVLDEAVVSSGRRFDRHGPVGQTIRDLKMTYKFMKGKGKQSD